MIYTITLNPALDRELVVSDIKFDDVLRTSEINIDYGGKGFNVSRMLKELGVDSVAVGFLGKNTGEKLQAGLRALGIDTDVVWIDGETRTNISIVSQSNNRYIKVNEPGPFIELEKQNELLEKLNKIIQTDDWVVLSGSLPKNVPPDFYARIIKIVNSHRASAILDTSGEALKLGLLEKPYLIKPNLKEACEVTGLSGNSIADIKSIASGLQELGAQNVVITMGEKGSLLQTDDRSWIINSPRITEKNPIGAGDSMVGGLLYGLSMELPLIEALKWGTACGAVAASLHGTQMGSKELIESFLSKIDISAA